VLIWGEQGVSPVQGGPHAPVAIWPAATATQHPEAGIQALQNLLHPGARSQAAASTIRVQSIQSAADRAADCSSGAKSGCLRPSGMLPSTR
jgi:hypothetical protein